MAKLRDELGKITPAIAPGQPLDMQENNEKISTAGSVVKSRAERSMTLNADVILEDENEDSDLPEIDDRSTRQPDIRAEYGLEPSKANSPHPPQMKSFEFTLPRDTSFISASASDAHSLSPYKESMKLFHPADTYTDAKLDNLLNESAGRSNGKISSRDNNQNEQSGDSIVIKSASPTKEPSAKRQCLDHTKAVLTTQDFMSQAENIMDMLRGLKRTDLPITDDADYSQRQSELTASYLGQSGDRKDSLQHSADPLQRPDFYDDERSASEDEPSLYESTGHRPVLPAPTHPPQRVSQRGNKQNSALYFDSIRNRYETSGTELAVDLEQGQRAKRSLADIGLSPVRQTTAAAVIQPERAVRGTLRIRNNVAQSSAQDSKHSPAKTSAGTPRSGTNGAGRFPRTNSSKVSNQTHQSETMQVIRQQDVINLIPPAIGSMVYDSNLLKWVRASQENAHANTGDEEDVFQGIEDLTDDGAEDFDNNRQHAEFVDEYAHSLHRSLSSLEEALSGSSISDRRSASPQKHQEYIHDRMTAQNMYRPSSQGKAQNHMTKPEVSFAIPLEEVDRCYAPDISYIEGRHDATAVSDLESSFSVAVQNLVKVLSDIYPQDPYWEDLTILDLHGRSLETLIRLEEWCPQLLDLNVCDNEIGYLTGVPSTVRILRATQNNFSQLTAFGFLTNLQYLDLSDNRIETLDGMYSANI